MFFSIYAYHMSKLYMSLTLHQVTSFDNNALSFSTCRYRLGLSVTSSLPAVVACTLRADLCCSHMIGTLGSHLGLLCRLRFLVGYCMLFCFLIVGLCSLSRAEFAYQRFLCVATGVADSGVVVLPVALYRLLNAI